MESKSSSGLLGIIAVAGIVLFIVMAGAGPGSKFATSWGYLTNGNVSQSTATGSTDYHALARQDAIDNGVDPTLFERQINQESGFNPNAQSNMGAIGIAQIMPSTAKAWSVDPWNATDSLRVAASHMAWYQGHYGSYEKALAAYNGGSSKLDYCIANYTDWKSCMPSETRMYITAIMGV